MHYDWELAAANRTAHIKQKRQCGVTLTVVGWNDNMTVYIASSESSKLKRFVQRWKKS